MFRKLLMSESFGGVSPRERGDTALTELTVRDRTVFSFHRQRPADGVTVGQALAGAENTVSGSEMETLWQETGSTQRRRVTIR